jgi:lipopolysaccharide transport system permease protein
MIINLFKINLRDRYLGSGLGPLWAIINPLLTLVIYSFLFTFVFKARIPGASSGMAYVIWFLSGFVPLLSISESMSFTTVSVVRSASLVKNIVFKVECIPIADTFVAMVPFTVGLLFVNGLLFINGIYPSWHFIVLVPLIIVQVILLAGIGLILSATAVFIRDLSQIIPTIVLLITFGTPIFYSIDALPDIARRLEYFNPFYHVIQSYRNILISHTLPELSGFIYLTCVSLLCFIVGLKYYRALKGFFTIVM